MRTFFVVAAVLVAVFATGSDVTLDFEGGVNLTNADADFSFRFTNTNALTNIPVVPDVLTWTSLSIDASAANDSAKASADVMFGLGVHPSAVTFPFAILAYASGKAAVDANIQTFAKNLIAANPKLDATFQGGVVAMAALSLQEVDADNKPVGKLVPFTTTLLDPCHAEELHGDSGNLNGIVCTYSPANTDAKVTITYVTSAKAGILKYGETPVSPRSLEMIIEVSGFTLSDNKNHIRMDLGLLTASGAGSVEGSANVVHREGQEDIYVAASTHAVIDGKRAEVEVSVKSGADDLDTFTEAVLKAALGGSIDAQIAHVDFPAGETSFVYDPACGSGSNVYEAGASSLALSALVALVCALLYLF